MMATETQTMSPAHAAPVHKVSRYHSARQAAAEIQMPSPPSPKQASPKAPNESILRSKSRYRKRSSKPDPLSSPPLPQPTSKPTRIPQSHSASLAALTGEPHWEDQEPPSSPREDAPSRPRQLPSPKNVMPPTKKAASRSTRARRHVLPIGEPPQPRQTSWETVCAARARTQPGDGALHQEAREILAAEDERIRRLNTQQQAEREGRSEKRRYAAAGEKRRQEEIEAEQQEGHEVQYKYQEQERQGVKQRQEAQHQGASERAPPAKKESVDLRRGVSIRQKLGSFTRTKSSGLLGSDKIQSLPEKKNLSASRRIPEAVSKFRPSSPVPASRSAPPIDLAPAAWVDAPVSRSLPEESTGIQTAQWVDAPVSRPIPQNDVPVLLPQYDAPISAVNAGERKVLVRCNGSSVALPVTPITTPQDLINSALKATLEANDPNCSKLVESFTQLGLERPLRNYEHVRDVMNSWDNDAQNNFIILPTKIDYQNGGLDSKNVPKQQPGDTSVYMYHSQRPGTWDKRWITLRSDGQVTVARRQGPETTNICHLTDFDVYTPTSRQQRKKIKPPKKICFAVKSQQKSNMFLDGANFVHFFATNDEVVAGEWYRAVQGWRSWYLVNVLGEGQKPRPTSATNNPARPTTSRSHMRDATGATPYHFASSEPLPTSSPGAVGLHSSAATAKATPASEKSHARKLSSRDRAPPPSAFLNKLSKDAESGASTTGHRRLPSIVKGPTPTEVETSTFAPTGLLGRTYSQRQRAQRGREINETRNDSLQSVDRAAGLTRKGSTKSVRQMPKPLVDLTPQYQEPPQHVRKGKGVTAEPGKQLVDVATGPDLPPGAILIPSATSWKRPQAHSPHGEYSPRPRRRSMDAGRSRMSIDGGRPRPSMDISQPQFNDDEPFLEGGLLARTSSKRAQGGGGTGHGVRTGDRNAIGRPMIDLQTKIQFADGSLLRQVEAHTGADGPIIDREKRHEESVRIGESV
jgi:hypothetical protein